MVLACIALVWPSRSCEIAPICYWYIQSATARIRESRGDEWSSEISDPSWWEVHWSPSFRTYLFQSTRPTSLRNLRQTAIYASESHSGVLWGFRIGLETERIRPSESRLENFSPFNKIPEVLVKSSWACQSINVISLDIMIFTSWRFDIPSLRVLRATRDFYLARLLVRTPWTLPEATHLNCTDESRLDSSQASDWVELSWVCSVAIIITKMVDWTNRDNQ